MASAAVAKVKPAKLGKKALPDLVRKHQKTIERAKQLYDRADGLLAQIIEPYLVECEECGHKALPDGDAVEIPLNADGKVARLLDNWANETIAWGHGAARKYSIKISKT